MFRAAVFEELGEDKLEGAVTTDICGKPDAFAIRLDKEAVDTIKKARLHRKVATSVFFESNGGQMRAEATLPEIRMAVGEPGMDIGNVETVLETMSTTCYYLSVEKNRYRFSLSANLNKMLADRRASIAPQRIAERVRSEVQKVFKKSTGIEPIPFPERSNHVPDRPVLTLVVLSPDDSLDDRPRTMAMMEAMTRECGASSRTFKNALIWCVPESGATLREEARKALAWEDIEDEDYGKLDDGQKKQLAINLKRVQQDASESVWRTYNNLALLGKDNKLRLIDLGRFSSSAAETIVSFILERLQERDEVIKGASPNLLLKNWPPAFKEWSTKSVRDAFYASPQFQRLLVGDAIKETIARGVASGHLAYIGKTSSGGYDPFVFKREINASDVEVSDDMFVVAREVAEAYAKAEDTTGALGAPRATPPLYTAQAAGPSRGAATRTEGEGAGESPAAQSTATRLNWTGEVPAQKWMNFYTKVLSRFATSTGLRLTVSIEVSPNDGVSNQRVEETKTALRELGLVDDVDVE